EDGYAELNLKGDFIFVNEALCRIDGYPKDELMKKSYRDIMDEENARKVFESYNRVFLTGDPEKNLEYEIFSKDGQKKYLDTSISAVKDESGQVVAFRGLVRDRTERIKAEEELRRSEEKYRNILETIREGYFEVDLAGNFTFFNDSVCRMSGFSRDELMGMNYSRLSANDETTRKVYQTFNRVYKTERPSEGYDWPIKRKDGSRGYVEASIMLRKDSSGGIIGFKGVIRNITERKQAEELLLASEKKYREIFNASSEAIFIHDAESAKIIDVNDSMLRIYGFNSKDEVLGCRVVDLSGDPQTGTEEEVLRLIKKTINEGPQIFEWLTRGKDGTTFWMEMQLKKTDIGGQGRILAVGRDITERKQAEEAIRENELRYRSLFDYSMDAILLTRPDDGTILDANKAACRMFGRTKQEIIDAGRTELVDTSDPRLEQLLQERARTGRMSGRLFHFRKDGTRFTAELTSSVFPDRAGTLQSCMILRDVTEREQMEVALRESEARYRTFIGATADIVYLKDSQFRYILVNKAMEEMLDKDQKDIIGKDDFQLMPLHAANKFRANDTQVVRTKSIMIVEERLGKRIYETTKFPVLLENGDVIIGGISRDITERKWAGEKIARSEKKFSAIFHFSPDPMAINDTKTLKFIDVNEAFTRWTGYSHGEVISGSLGDFDLFVNPEESEMIINALTDSREIKNAEMMIRRKDGNIRNVLFSSRIIEIDQENYILTLVHDITERKQAENKLKETEERYNALFEQSIDLVFVVGFDGRFLDANSAAFDLVGYTRDEISSLSIVNLLDDDQIPVALELIREISEYGVQQGLREFRLRHKNGTPIYVETQGASIMSNGKPVAIQGIARDITARKKAEEELLSLTRRLNDIIEFIPDATLVIDREGRVIAWNRAIEEMTGFTKDAVLGKGHYEYAIPFYGRRKPMLIDLLDKRDKKLEVSYKYVERGSKIYAETYIPELRNGQGAHLWGVAAPLFDKDGNRFGSIEVIRDITEIKAKEKSLEESLRSKEIAEEATKAKSAFLANMSHEIRTPMNGIIGLVNLALQTDLSDKQRDYLNKIESSAQGLLVIINDILDYSKIEADKMKLETLDFNLEEIMTHISDIMYPHAAQKSLDLFFHIDRNVPLALKGDPLRLQQVLINLIGNAVKFTEKGEVVVRVDLSDKFRSGRKDYIRLKFSVKDTGIGLTKEQMGDLFELFTQADSSVTRRYGGTGLGLAISRQIVQLMGGKIEAASEAGKGSVFTFLIPLGVGKKKKANRMPLPVTTLKNKRALVVDESPTAREVLADYLESFGFKVTTAASGSKALKILKEKNNFHLLLVASETSAQDGIKIVRMIRKNAA
ncbi:MAG TPA: PAS domain S-box protein, partial [Desulfobacterales bacterium]|nr:PAS domain S-box protein [Desulfobacterales bacterium]